MKEHIVNLESSALHKTPLNRERKMKGRLSDIKPKNASASDQQHEEVTQAGEEIPDRK